MTATKSREATAAVDLVETAKSLQAWLMAPLAAVAMVATLPGRSHGLGLITEPMLQELGLERTTYGHINFWATLVGSLACWPVGRAIDRFGARKVAGWVLLLLGLTVVAMANVRGKADLFAYVLWTRAIGQSALSVVSIVIIAKWFTRGGGPAMSVYGIMIGIGFAAAFGIATGWVKENGWREAWANVGWTAIGLAPVFWLLVRNPPPAVAVSPNDELQSTTLTDGMTLNQALASGAFWMYAVATSLYGLAVSGTGLFNQSILEEFGFGFADYRTMLITTSTAGLVGQAACGITLRFAGVGKCLGAAMCGYAAALLLLPEVGTKVQLQSCAGLMGASGGAVSVVFFACWGAAFGRAHLGRIQGAAQMLTVLASALGPLLFAEIQSRTGSYAPAFWLLAVSALGCALAAFVSRAPVHGVDYNCKQAR